MEVTLDEHGRISVPEALRDKLGLEAGAQLSLEIEGETLLLTPISERGVLKERNGLLVSTADVDQEIDVESVIDKVRADRSQNIADSQE
ncbi:MAG: AbrB/MazE/SpoVT family DNA-binding domain-containing protein [Salinibacter sp.]|jgi:looped-hinge helix DNA binding domain, AbrB family|uniref:AbrB/MazE/SpoVT family DNA-binding domain-containing protein n=1 Tax=Salinibacter sp. TaxID=2065818 RepID=UPI002FC30DBC